MVTDAGTEPSQPLPPPPSPPGGGGATGRIHRRPDRGPLGGVCAGIAEHFGLDVGLVRVGAVVLGLMGPGIPAYVVAWIFFPAAPGGPPPSGAGRGERGSQVLGIFLILVALTVLWGDWWFFDRGWFLPLGLIALGA